MSNSVAGFLHKGKMGAIMGVYGLASFALAGLLAGVLEEHVGAILVGWIASLFIAAALIKR